MAIEVVMPKMGESIMEGTILEWKKNPGDKIERDETLLEISTDKVDSEIPSPAEGFLLDILFKPNDTVEVGTVIAHIGDAGEKPEFHDTSVEEVEPKTNETTVESIKVPNSEQSSKVKSSKFYSPLVRSIAKKENISIEELDSIKGSGQNGRVNKHDVLLYLDERLKQKPETIEIPTAPTHIPVERVKMPEQSYKPLEDKIEPMDRMRIKIAQHMVQSKQISPHVYSTSEVDVENLVEIRKQSKEDFKQKYNLNLTYTPMILDCCVRAINEFPLLNASVDGENIVHHQNVNMGIAVALENNNLIVPVIKAAEEKNFVGLARASADMAIKAREHKLDADDIFGSTFTLTNPGIFGSLFGMGIINQPNVGILSTGTIHKRPVVKETEYGDVIVVRHMMYMTLGYDHRIIDGAYGTRFLTRLVQLIEQFDSDRIS